MRPLVEHLADDSVDGDILLDAIDMALQTRRSACLTDLKPFFDETTPVAALAQLARHLQLFVLAEREAARGEKTARHKVRDEAKQQKLEEAIAQERERAVQPQAAAALFKAAAAEAQARSIKTNADRRAHFDAHGHIFKCTWPLEGAEHFKYYREHQEEMRALIGHALTDEDGAPRTGDDGEPLIEPAKLIFSSQVTSDSAAKKKGGGRGAKQVLSQKIRVSGEFLKEWFSNCTKEINWLAPEGPFAQP
eukprot:1794695-Prymnesium_polylepis.1